MIRPQIGKRVRFYTWDRGGSEYRGPEDRSKFIGEVVGVNREYGIKYMIKRDADGEIQYCSSQSLIEYV